MAGQSFHIRIGERAHQARVEISSGGAAPRVQVDGEDFEVLRAPGGALVVRSLRGGAHRCVTLDGQEWPQSAHVPGGGAMLEVQTAQAAALAAALAAGGAGGAAASKIKAPMPGRVVRILVAEGEAVEKGAAVIIVEAMKMENEMYAAAAGVIKRLAVSQGDTVEAGQLLCELELKLEGA
ncbi:MAG: biotin attachment protein [Myxococcales bacterium]|nr:biotin attachment protein [Myxococcales bacterium]